MLKNRQTRPVSANQNHASSLEVLHRNLLNLSCARALIWNRASGWHMSSSTHCISMTSLTPHSLLLLEKTHQVLSANVYPKDIATTYWSNIYAVAHISSVRHIRYCGFCGSEKSVATVRQSRCSSSSHLVVMRYYKITVIARLAGRHTLPSTWHLPQLSKRHNSLPL